MPDSQKTARCKCSALLPHLLQIRPLILLELYRGLANLSQPRLSISSTGVSGALLLSS